jgi:hypothetical protein
VFVVPFLLPIAAAIYLGFRLRTLPRAPRTWRADQHG